MDTPKNPCIEGRQCLKSKKSKKSSDAKREAAVVLFSFNSGIHSFRRFEL